MREDKPDPKRWPHQQPAVLAAGTGEWTLSGPEHILVVTALDRLGRDTLGLLELINRLATMCVDLKVLDMPVDAQDVAGGGPLVALVTAGVAVIERANISRQTKQRLERARGGGQAGRAGAGASRRAADAHHTTDAEGPVHVLGPDRTGSGIIGIAGAASPEDVEALPATAFKGRWD